VQLLALLGVSDAGVLSQSDTGESSERGDELHIDGEERELKMRNMYECECTIE
jgi:hypothetical protein